MIRWFCLLIKMTLLAILIVHVSPTTSVAPSNVTQGSVRSKDSTTRQPPVVSTTAQVLFFLNVTAVPLVLVSFIGFCIFHVCRRVKNIDRFRSYKDHHLKPGDWDADRHLGVPQIDSYFERNWFQLFAKEKKKQ